MKRVIIGISGVVSGVLLLGLTNIAVVIYAAHVMLEFEGWDSGLGLYGSALLKIGSVPIVLSLILIWTGVHFLVKEFQDDSDPKTS